MKGGTSSKDLLKVLKAAGWELIRFKRHPVYGCPYGCHQTAIPSTPGRGRSTANTIALITRLQRECQEAHR